MSIAGSHSPPDLLLLPGLDGSAVLFEPLLAALPAEVTARVVSLPADADNDYDGLLPIVRDALPAGKTAVVIGWSFSGPLAIRLAAAHPDRIVGVVLVASFARNPHPWAGFLRGLVLRSWVVSLFPALSHAKALLGGYATPTLRILLRRAHTGLPAAVLAQRLRAVASCDVRAELQTLSMPLLYLRSRRDLVVPAHNARQVLRLAPDAREVVIDGPHLALATNPQASAAAIVAFVRDGLRG